FIQLSGVKPNVLLVVDNSGSMYEFAYKTPGKGGSSSNADDSYISSATYYGYFNSSSQYSYDSTGGGFFYADTAGTWSGNFLNWVAMRRVDVVRKVLIGGKATPRSQAQVNYLIAAENPDRDFWKKINTQYYKVSSGASYEQIRVCSTSSCTSGSTYNVRVQVGTTVPTGLLHDNIDEMRFGLMFFNTDEGGYVAKKVGTDITSLVTDISNTDPSTWTPLGESMYEALRFFQNGNKAYASGTYSTAFDPMEGGISCQDNFVLFLTDGESTQDRNIPGSYWGSTITDSNFSVRTYMDRIAVNDGYPSQWSTSANSMAGTYYLEAVSFYSHVNDIRSNITGDQNITTYTVYAFDDSPIGRTLLQKAAKYGGFDDYSGDGKPFTDSTCGTASANASCSEWDRDKDGVPDTYFEAQEGAALESELNKALTDIMRRTASGTSASVLATTGEGEGAVYQAYFLPSKLEGATEIKWIGYLHGLFVDKYGNMREDTDEDKRLCYSSGDPAGCTSTDKIVLMFYDDSVVPNRTRIKLYPGTVDADGNPTGTYTTIEFDDMKKIWEGGRILWSRDLSSSPRTIKTTVDGTNMIDFSASNRAALRPFLMAASDDEAEAVVKYISGEDDPIVNSTTYDYRPRKITVDLNGDGDTSDTGEGLKVWKLGDIVYSTPVAVARPAENYSLLYSDSTYAQFVSNNKNRRHVVYAGANDGMLHAFNGGFYDATNLKFWKNYSGGTFSDSSSYGIGDELWGFIPQSLLPHLKWLTDDDYTHVYYVDLKPKVVDARIFTEELVCAVSKGASGCIHPYGWGTVLIGGMRFGGRDIAFQDSTWTAQRTFRSAYFALDITDPLNPVLLWTLPVTSSSYPSGSYDLGLTTVYPAVLRVGADMTAAGTWYTVMGSGPDAGTDSYKGASDRYANIYIVNLFTGEVSRTFTLTDNYSFMADPITVDVNLNDKVDVIYMGDTYCQTGAVCTSSNWKGKMYRIITNLGDSDTANWGISTLYDAAQPVTSASAASLDDKANLWVYFGTGRFFDVDDNTLDGTESWSFYGIKDKCQPWINASCASQYDPILTSTLFNATNVQVSTSAVVTGTAEASTFSGLETALDDANKNGWYLNFSRAGERSLYKPGVLGGITFWTTYVPSDDVCYLGGNSYLYAAYYKTGTAYTSSVIGLSGTTVLRDVYLGKGMPSSVGFSVTSGSQTGAMAFIQQSTGAILQLEATTPFAIRSGIVGWRTGGP
ncbi:MAG: hypothetical protein HY759_04675, partial [Nitrospirae bacterium]|nr:hypothetical protein [Nitrospirota bacterium]